MIIPLLNYVTSLHRKEVTNPGTVSYDIVKMFVNDPLAESKLAFFVIIGKQAETFLTRFQTDKPMAVFLTDALENLMTSFTKTFIKSGISLSEVLDTSKATYKYDTSME